MEKKTLEAVQAFTERESRAPSITEVARELGLKKAGAQRHLRGLYEKKRLRAPKVVMHSGYALTALGKKDLAEA